MEEGYDSVVTCGQFLYLTNFITSFERHKDCYKKGPASISVAICVVGGGGSKRGSMKRIRLEGGSCAADLVFRRLLKFRN